MKTTLVSANIDKINAAIEACTQKLLQDNQNNFEAKCFTNLMEKVFENIVIYVLLELKLKVSFECSPWRNGFIKISAVVAGRKCEILDADFYGAGIDYYEFEKRAVIDKYIRAEERAAQLIELLG